MPGQEKYLRLSMLEGELFNFDNGARRIYFSDIETIQGKLIGQLCVGPDILIFDEFYGRLNDIVSQKGNSAWLPIMPPKITLSKPEFDLLFCDTNKAIDQKVFATILDLKYTVFDPNDRFKFSDDSRGKFINLKDYLKYSYWQVKLMHTPLRRRLSSFSSGTTTETSLRYVSNLCCLAELL